MEGPYAASRNPTSDTMTISVPFDRTPAKSRSIVIPMTSSTA